MVLHMILTFSVLLWLALMAVAEQLGFSLTLGYIGVTLVVSPVLSTVLVMAIAQLADWSERHARARRRAKAAARKLAGGQ